MKKSILIFLLAVCLIFPSACNIKTDDGRLKVCVSLYPIYDFTQKIGGDKVNIINLTPTGDSHHYEPSLYDVAQISESDLFFYNGAGLEHWVEDVIVTVKGNKVKAVAVSEGIELLNSEGHGHEEEGEDEDEHEHEFDPHVWLYPLNARKQMENIKNALALADPDNAEYYEANYQLYKTEFDLLDGEYIAEIKDKISDEFNTIVVAHKAFGYLCHAYGLEQVALTDVNDSGERSNLNEIIDLISEKNIKYIFYDELEGNSTILTLSTDTQTSLLPLNNLSALTQQQKVANDDYFSIMRKNLQSLKTALF